MRRPVCQISTVLVAVVSLLLLTEVDALASCGEPPEIKIWSPPPSIEKPVITKPKNNAVCLVNEEVPFTCDRGTDEDSWSQNGQSGKEADEMAAQSNYPSWSASAGSWKGDDNKGSSVTWVAPPTPQSDIIVGVEDNDLPKPVVPPDTGTRDDSPVSADQVTITVVEMLLTQDHDLWWFNGPDPANYHIQVTLTLVGITEGTFTWRVTAGTDKVNFENDQDEIETTDDNDVVLKSTGASATMDDITVVVKWNETDYKGGKNVTVYRPHEEEEYNVVDENLDVGEHEGYKSRHYFRIKDQFGTILPNTVALNEHWTEGAQNDHDPETTWDQMPAASWMAIPGGDKDDLWTVAWGAEVPHTTHPQSPLGDEKVDHWNGEHYVGSLIEGQGIKVLTKKWQYWTDHARRE